MSGSLLLRLENGEAKALSILLNALTYDDVANLIERAVGVSPEITEKAYEIWDIADSFNMLLLDHGYDGDINTEELKDA